MDANPNPYLLDTSLLRALSGPGVEVWVKPRPSCNRFPLAVVFYVPPGLAELIPPRTTRNRRSAPQKSRRGPALTVLD